MVSTMSCIRKEWRELCSQRERVSLPVSKPPFLAGYLSLRGQPQGHPFVGEISGEWDYSWFRMWLSHHSTSQASIPWSSWAFLPASTPARKPELTRVDESLSPSLRGAGGHVNTLPCPFKSQPLLILACVQLLSREPTEHYPPSMSLRPGLSSFLPYNLSPYFLLPCLLNPRELLGWGARKFFLVCPPFCCSASKLEWGCQPPVPPALGPFTPSALA